MNAVDKNRNLEPPEGVLVATYAKGAFLSLVYYTATLRTEVFLNDQGREVLRTTDEWERFEKEPEIAPVAPVQDWSDSIPNARWNRLCAGFWLALFGIQEMLKCLRLRSRS